MATEIDYDAMVWDEPAAGTRVTVPCVRCSEPVQAEYDTGEPTTRDHPGVPAMWYAVDDESACGHAEDYTREEEDEFYAACDRAAYATEA